MFSNAIKYLLESFGEYIRAEKPPEGIVRIHVDEIASKIAQGYEKIRNVVDYREEHLLRSHSISRSLQRSILLYGKKEELALRLIKEMVRSGHFPNNRIPEEKMIEVDRLIGNLIFLLEYLKKNFPKKKTKLSGWLMGVVACAIEESIDPPKKDRASAEAMFRLLSLNLTITGKKIDDKEKLIQLFIAVQRALLRVDDDQLAYRLLTFLYPHWASMALPELELFAEHLPKIKKDFDSYMSSALCPHFFRLCNQYNTVFLLLSDIVFSKRQTPETLEAIFRDPAKLSQAIDGVYRARYDEQSKRLRRLAFFSVISLFITKVIVALAIEIPIDTYLTHQYLLLNTVINILFPPFLMIFIIGFIHLPSAKNLELAKAEVRAATYASEKKKYLLQIPEEKSIVVQWVVRFFFLAVSTAVLWAVWMVLQIQHFSIASTVVFVFFTSIVAATGVRVHNRAKDISLETSKPTMLTFAGDMLFMPFVTIGKLAIDGLSRFKFLVFIFNIIDAPFQVFVLFIENFNSFLRSRKEQMY